MASVIVDVAATNGTLTHAQLLALRATPVEVIPAPGANKIIQIIKCLLYWDRAGGAVFTIAAPGDDFSLRYGGTAISASPESTPATGFIDQATAMVQIGSGYSGVLSDAANCINKSVTISNVGGAEWTNGGTSEIKYHITYTIIDIS